MILAPLRGVTIRCFRETFAEPIRAAGFTEAITPFISANAGVDPLRDRELRGRTPTQTPEPPNTQTPLLLTPQFIGKDPAALKACLERIREAGYETADLNCGCPFPMVRNKGRGSGILRTPDVLARMLEVGCETMGPGRFSIKARLGVERPDELLKLMPVINGFPLRYLTVHARTARQMYEGPCDWAAFEAVASVAKVPLVRNGDIPVPTQTRTPQPPNPQTPLVMVGRPFIRDLGEREDIAELLARYIAASRAELCGDHPVLGRMKELTAYWKDLPRWRRLWPVIKLCRSVAEFEDVVCERK